MTDSLSPTKSHDGIRFAASWSDHEQRRILNQQGFAGLVGSTGLYQLSLQANNFAMPPTSSPNDTGNVIQLTPIAGTMGGQPLMLGTAASPVVLMPTAYAVATPQLQPYGQNFMLQGGINVPVQPIMFVPGAPVLPNPSSNMMMIPTYPTSAPFQTYFPAYPTALSAGAYSLMSSTCGNDASDEDAVVPNPVPSMQESSVHEGQLQDQTQRPHTFHWEPPPRKRSKTDRRYASNLVSHQPQELKLRGVGPLILYQDRDSDHLSSYQCFLRQQIELFEADFDDLQWNCQKMNKGVVVGQVGLRCRHCAKLAPWFRSIGAVYYAATLQGLYQAAQNMSNNHLAEQCADIPEEIRKELLEKKKGKRKAGGGKLYWADSASDMGVVEDSYGLRFKDN